MRSVPTRRGIFRAMPSPCDAVANHGSLHIAGDSHPEFSLAQGQLSSQFLILDCVRRGQSLIPSKVLLRSKGISLLDEATLFLRAWHPRSGADRIVEGLLE